MEKTNSRLKSFLLDLEKLRDETGLVQEWFRMARDCANGTFQFYHMHALRQSFLTGAIPEVFNMDQYSVRTCLREDIQAAKRLGLAWRKDNPPAIVGCWYASVRFEKDDGAFTYYKLPLDPRLIDHFIKRVKRSKSFV